MRRIYKYMAFAVILTALSSCYKSEKEIAFKKFESKNKEYVGSLVILNGLPEGFKTIKDPYATKVAYNISISGDDQNNCIVAAFNAYGNPMLKAPLIGDTYVNIKKTGNEVLAVVCKKQDVVKKYKASMKTSFILNNKTYEYVEHTKIITPAS